MGDVDKLQIAEEAAAKRDEEAVAEKKRKQKDRLRREPVRATALTTRRAPQEISLKQIHSGDNIRLDLPEIEELARSIRELGLLTPLLVRPWDSTAEVDGKLPASAAENVDNFKLIAGHRRLAALTALTDADVNGFDKVQCEVRAGITQAEAYALMLTENVQRVPLEPIQAARALRLLLDLNDGMDAATLARSLGMRPAWVQTNLRLLDLPQEVQDRIEAGDLSVTIADLLRRGQTTGRLNEERVKEIASKVASGEITTAEAKAAAAPPKKPNTAAPKTVNTNERELIENDPRDQWKRVAPSQVDSDGEPLVRPATPLSSPSGPPINHPATDPASTEKPHAQANNSLPLEEQLDAYILARATQEWASDAYLDELGIDRIQCEAWAQSLGFEERISMIRKLSYTLMQEMNTIA